MLKETKEMKHYLIKYNYHVKMDSADISSLFPLDNDEQLNAFMKQDHEWDQRRKESFILPYIKYEIFTLQLTNILLSDILLTGLLPSPV